MALRAGREHRALSRCVHVRRQAAPGFHSPLRPYQVRGYSWFMRNLRAGMGAIIADDMGLGKTLQVITVLEKLRLDGELDVKQVLVVVPTTLLANWKREIARFAPNLTVSLFYGP